MNRFFQDITTAYWWLSVVLVGLILSITAEYLKKYIDRAWAKRSKRKRETIEQKRLETKQTIEQLTIFEDFRTYYQFKILEERLEFTHFLILGGIIFSAALFVLNYSHTGTGLVEKEKSLNENLISGTSIFFLIISAMLIISSIRSIIRYHKRKSIISEVYLNLAKKIDDHILTEDVMV